jgi:hypothetical protein
VERRRLTQRVGAEEFPQSLAQSKERNRSVLSAIGTLALILTMVLSPLAIPVLITVRHALSSARARRRDNTGGEATATRTPDHRRSPAADRAPSPSNSISLPDNSNRNEAISLSQRYFRDANPSPITKLATE